MAPFLEHTVSRRDAGNFCAVTRVVCTGSSSVVVEFESVSDCEFGTPPQDALDARILWGGGAARPAVVELYHSGGRMSGALAFERLPAEALGFSFGPGAGYSAVRLAPVALGAQPTEAVDGPALGPKPATPSDSVELTVLDMNGSLLATLQCSRSDLVRDVRRKLVRASGAALGEHRLVCGSTVLKDREALAPSVAQRPAVTLLCIRMGPSGISRHLEARRASEDPDVAIDASLAELADGVMQREHAVSERARPCPADMLESITPTHRGELINWMVEAFDLLCFDDSILHGVVLTLDRYCSILRSPIDIGSIQRILLAAVCTELKLASEDILPRGQWQRILTHLCHGRLSVASILREEQELLMRLGFMVAVPTSLTFFRQLSVRVHEAVPAVEAAQRQDLALFLLELALFEPELQHCYPHAVLAAGAVSAALRSWDAPGEQHEAVLEDLATYCPGLCGLEATVQNCEEDLLELWLGCSVGKNPWCQYYERLEMKFGLRSRQSSAGRCPAESLGRLRAAREPGSGRRSVPEEAGSYGGDMVYFC